MATSSRTNKNRSILPRLTSIHDIINSNRFPSQKYLAERFGVSVRTIERDISQMRNDYAAPIEYSASKNGYYYSAAFSGMVFSDLSEREEIALMLAREVLNSEHLQDLGNSINGLIQNANSKYPDKFSITSQRMSEHISCIHAESPTISEDQIHTLINAIFEQHVLAFEYQKPGGIPESRVIHPYHLTNAEGDWYLKGHCESRKELRTFKLQRISNLRTLNTGFISDPGYDVLELIHGSMGGFSGNRIYEIIIELDTYATQYLEEKQLHETQDLEISPDGTALLTLHLNNLMDIKRWLFSWGEHARAINPPELVESIRETLRLCHENY